MNKIDAPLSWWFLSVGVERRKETITTEVVGDSDGEVLSKYTERPAIYQKVKLLIHKKRKWEGKESSGMEETVLEACFYRSTEEGTFLWLEYSEW